MDLPSAIVLACYVTLAVELTFLSVPSIVSTRERLRAPEAAGFARKLRLVLPITLIVMLFLLPPAAVLAPVLLDYLLPLPALRAPAIRWSGAALLVLGTIITPASVPPLRRALAENAVARSGLFAWSRHPGLVGMFAFYLGNALVLPCVVLLTGFPLYVLYMHRRALMEETYLRARFPRAYDEYATRVPRYLGVRSVAAVLQSYSRQRVG